MFLIGIYLIVLIVVITLFLYSRKEGFNSHGVTTTVMPTAPTIIEPTTTSLEDMNEIDFSEIENSEKILRDEKSKELNNCLGKYVNRDVKSFREVSEIMFSEVEDCENIFQATEVDTKKKYFDQMNYW